MADDDKPLKFKDLPSEDKPREKLRNYGAQALTSSELLAILLRTGTKERSVMDLSRDLILKFKNLTLLSQITSVEKLTSEIKGIGPDKAVTLLAAFEIAKRIKAHEKFEDPHLKISSADDVAQKFLALLRNELVEKFMAVALSSSNTIIASKVISSGNLDASIVHPREVFRFAIENSAKSVILIHNHPSGNTEPSKADIEITNKLVAAGEIFSIPILDHIIIAGDSYTSLAGRGLLGKASK